jgi:hypothetical protein
VSQLYRDLKIRTSEFLVESEPVKLTLLDEFLLWIERLCNEAEIYYYWNKVERTRQVPSRKIVVIGGTVYVHPQMLIVLEDSIKNLK